MFHATMLFLMTLLTGAGLRAPVLAMDRPDIPIEYLEAEADVVVVGTCERIEESAKRNGGYKDTTYTHHLKVERVCRDARGTIKVGDMIAVRSQTRAWVGRGSPPTGASGHRGMPAKGKVARVYAMYGADQGLVHAIEPNGWQPPSRTVAFIAADDEYKSEETLPKLAAWLEADFKGVISPVQAFAADPATGKPDVQQRSHIANLDKLDSAEAAVIYMRWRELDSKNWRHLEEFLMTGRPIVGLRTSTHMLRTGDPALDVELPIRVFGQKWIRHAGHQTRTRVLPPESDHPIVRGMKGDFVVRSWLYEVLPLPSDCTVLLWGEAEGGDGSLGRQPLVWVREATKETVRPFEGRGLPARRMAFTTLGHPEDFEHEEVRRLVERMVIWACGEDAAIQ